MIYATDRKQASLDLTTEYINNVLLTLDVIFAEQLAVEAAVQHYLKNESAFVS